MPPYAAACGITFRSLSNNNGNNKKIKMRYIQIVFELINGCDIAFSKMKPFYMHGLNLDVHVLESHQLFLQVKNLAQQSINIESLLDGEMNGKTHSRSKGRRLSSAEVIDSPNSSQEISAENQSCKEKQTEVCEF